MFTLWGSELPSDIEVIDPLHEHWKNVSKPLVVESNDNINLLELIPVWQAILRFGPKYKSCHLVLRTDNTQVISMVNCGRSSNTSCMCLIRKIFWLCIFYDIYLTARYLAGCDNQIADLLSRIDDQSLPAVVDSCLLCCSHG